MVGVSTYYRGGTSIARRLPQGRDAWMFQRPPAAPPQWNYGIPEPHRQGKAAVSRAHRPGGFPQPRWLALARLADFRDPGCPASQGSRIPATPVFRVRKARGNPRRQLPGSASLADSRDGSCALSQASRISARPVARVTCRLAAPRPASGSRGTLRPAGRGCRPSAGGLRRGRAVPGGLPGSLRRRRAGRAGLGGGCAPCF